MKKLFILMLFASLFACDKKDDGEGTKADFERIAENLTVYFYGDEYSEDAGTMNYYISFCDVPIGGDLESEWFYTLDLYASEGSFDKIPNGTYTLDIDSSCSGGTLAYAESFYLANAEKEYGFTDAKFEVSDNKLVLTATTDDGKTHKVTYSGNYKVIDDRTEPGGWEDDEPEENEGELDESTLTGDVEVSYPDEEVYAAFYGDDYDMGYGVLNLYFETEDFIGDGLYLEIATENTDFVGTYSPCKNWDVASTGNLIAANIQIFDGETYRYGSWYFHSTDGESYDEIAPIVSGSLSITDNGDSTYTFAFEGYDAVENGNKISFNWTGGVYVDDYTAESVVRRQILNKEIKVLSSVGSRSKLLGKKSIR